MMSPELYDVCLPARCLLIVKCLPTLMRFSNLQLYGINSSASATYSKDPLCLCRYTQHPLRTTVHVCHATVRGGGGGVYYT